MEDPALIKFMPEGLRRPDDLPVLLDRLVAKVGEQVAAKVAGGNALRVLREVIG